MSARQSQANPVSCLLKHNAKAGCSVISRDRPPCHCERATPSSARRCFRLCRGWESAPTKKGSVGEDSCPRLRLSPRSRGPRVLVACGLLGILALDLCLWPFDLRVRRVLLSMLEAKEPSSVSKNLHVAKTLQRCGLAGSNLRIQSWFDKVLCFQHFQLPASSFSLPTSPSSPAPATAPLAVSF